MDQQTRIIPNAEPGTLALDSVDNQTMDAIESVANTLASIGDSLCQSHELFCDSGVDVATARLYEVLEACLNIFVLVLKASS